MPLLSEDLFNRMSEHLKTNGSAVVKKVNAVFHFEVREKKGGDPTVFTVDLKHGSGRHICNHSGKIKKGKEGKADTTFIILDKDMMSLASGKLDPQVAFMQGKMKIRGNLGKAQKFTPDLLPKSPKL